MRLRAHEDRQSNGQIERETVVVVIVILLFYETRFTQRHLLILPLPLRLLIVACAFVIMS